MIRLTYLFGAGASALTLPTVENIPSSLKHFRDTLRQAEIQGTYFPTYKDLIIKEIDKIVHDLTVHPQNIDEYAREIGRKDHNALRNLKAIVSLLFQFTTIVKGVDPRYRRFFNSIANPSSFALPKFIKIISWNYDQHFEIAYRDFAGLGGLRESRDRLGVVSKFIGKSTIPEGFSIFKINGTASFYHSKTFREQLTMREDSKIDQHDFICMCYAQLLTDQYLEPSLSYSWEQDEDKISELASNATVETDRLVIIGYSLPFFNKDIDRQLIGRMINLKKIYIQDPKPDAVIKRLKTFTDVECEVIPELDRFYLPYEITL